MDGRRLSLLLRIAVLLSVMGAAAGAATIHITSTFMNPNGGPWTYRYNWNPNGAWPHNYTSGHTYVFHVRLPASSGDRDMEITYNYTSDNVYVQTVEIGESSGAYSTTLHLTGSSPRFLVANDGTIVRQTGVLHDEGRVYRGDITNYGTIKGFGTLTTGLVTNTSEGLIHVTGGSSGDKLSIASLADNEGAIKVDYLRYLSVGSAWRNVGDISLGGGRVEGETLTNWTGGTIKGFGTITANFGNYGLMEASVAGQMLYATSTNGNAGTIIVRDRATFRAVGDRDFGNNRFIENYGGMFYSARNLVNMNSITGYGTFSGAPVYNYPSGHLSLSLADHAMVISNDLYDYGTIDGPGDLEVHGDCTNEGAMVVGDSSWEFTNLLLSPGGSMSVQAGMVRLSGKWENECTDPTALSLSNESTLAFTGSDVKYFEVAGNDLGPVWAGLDRNNFAVLGKFVLEEGSLKLLDVIDNSLGDRTPEALYVQNILVADGATLYINGLALYYASWYNEPGWGGDIFLNSGVFEQIAGDVPLPSTITLLGAGIALLALHSRRRKRTG